MIAPLPMRVVRAALLAAASAASGEWAVSDALLRFDFTVQSKPSVPSAGLLVFVPDGGLLPTPAPKAVVRDASGAPLESECLWHHAREGFALVVAEPSTPAFSVYVGRQSRLTRNPRAAFTPSLLLYTKTGKAGLDQAARLAGGFPPGRDASLGQVQVIGHQQNPFGPNTDYSSWYTGYLHIQEPGRYYIATISDEGSIARIDGKNVAEWPGLHTRMAGRQGQFGSVVELAAGLRRVEYFHFNADGPAEAQLVWRRPGKTGGLPELVPASAYVRSGTTRLAGAAARDGGPVAIPAATCESYFWFGDQPANLFMFEARLAAENPEDTAYEWRLDGPSTLREQTFLWIVEGDQPASASLTARSGTRAVSATCPVRVPTTPPAANVNNPSHRTRYRTALLNRCLAAPPSARPAASWSPGLWALLLNVVEPFKGQALLTALFERSREDIAKNTSPSERALLEELFAENLYYGNPVAAAAWYDRFEREEKDPDRKRNWALARIELALYRTGDTNLARSAATALVGQAPGSEAGILALVRLGDIEARSGQFDAARAFYAQAQAKTPRQSAAAEKRRPPPPSRAPGGSAFADRVEPWKAGAVRGGAYYETIRTLIQGGYLRETRTELRNWELELPMEKLGGEFPVAEAEYFMTIRDYARALLILRIYRQANDMSPFLPKAMGMELDCLQRLGRADESRELAALILKSFPGHPVTEQAGRFSPASAAGREAASPVEAP